jgi:ubiquitin carboxyl-terminal hydrolase 36/42
MRIVNFEFRQNYCHSLAAPLSYAKVLQTTESNTNEKNNASSSGSSTSSSQLPKPKRVLFDNVQLGWNSPQVRCWGSGSGFNNIGNTCYLNSALQAFLHVPAIAQWLMSDKDHREKCKGKTG